MPQFVCLFTIVSLSVTFSDFRSTVAKAFEQKSESVLICTHFLRDSLSPYLSLSLSAVSFLRFVASIHHEISLLLLTIGFGESSSAGQSVVFSSNIVSHVLMPENIHVLPYVHTCICIFMNLHMYYISHNFAIIYVCTCI